MPREYYTALRRRERERQRREVEWLQRFPPGLAKAALRFRQASDRGSNARLAREHYRNSPYF